MAPDCVGSCCAATTWAHGIPSALRSKLSCVSLDKRDGSRAIEGIVLVAEHDILTVHVVRHADFNDICKSGGK